MHMRMINSLEETDALIGYISWRNTNTHVSFNQNTQQAYVEVSEKLSPMLYLGFFLG